MDILLVIPPRTEDDHGYTPAAAAVLKGNVMQAGFTSKIIDFNAEIDDFCLNNPNLSNSINNFFNYNTFYNKNTWLTIKPMLEEWADRIISYNPKWLGISVFSYNSHRATRLLSLAVKMRNKDIKIVIGGSGIKTDKTFAETLYEQKIINAYIKGDGEVSLVELLQGNTSYPGINGIPPIQINNLDSLAYPNYDDYELARYESQNGLQALPITGSKGCVRNCTFCDINAAWPKYYYRSGKSIASEIKYQVEKYDVQVFRFTDSLTNGSMKAFREMCYHLAEFRKTLSDDKKFIWEGHFIVRSTKQMSPKDFDLMKQSGAELTWIGFESGSERVRKHMKKGYTNADMNYTMEQLDRVGIKTRMLMIVGYPTETEEDFQQTKDLFDEWLPYLHTGTIDEVQLGATLNLLPRTPLADNKEKYRILQPTNHINNWLCLDNPTLTYKERLKRRILLQAHVERLGYTCFMGQDYIKQMQSQWEQVKNLDVKAEQYYLDNFMFDRENAGIIAKLNY